MKYWKECIQEAFDDAGIVATDEQIENVAGWVEGAHENFGAAHGHDVMFRNQRNPEIDKLKAQVEGLEKERDRIERNFLKNVATRNNCETSDVELGESGEAFIRR